ncbi:hypothetical protein Belba_0573 [Belliella baltica DSM 15883]|uniref:PorZ N-terminal beta-propeller domain-containing protein n=1 Tax=Belliella baltica (strain DSM 15883 / CIP 108006 / LMG 21964 / BA134) TaxID=866536 RepID=I3Z1W2_BELBD|nr:T9SS type A sorting domain-containing protein [Belliella baltica]AFL83230.1 hypothetical protein Belba_0573 [Belliella baltica DSM 15883]
MKQKINSNHFQKLEFFDKFLKGNLDSLWKIVGISLIFVLIPLIAFSQSNIPVGTWKTHHSYLDPAKLTGSDQTIFHVGEESLFYFSISSQEANPITKIDGLYGHDFTTATFDSQSKKLILAYSDGTIDLVGENDIITINTLRNNTQLESKQINSIKIIDQNAFLAGNYGIGIIDAQSGRFIDSYINIGTNGSSIPINDIAEAENSFYLATDLGILIGNKSTNLKDFRNWTLSNSAISGGFKEIERIENSLIALGNDTNLYLVRGTDAELIFGTENSQSLKSFSSGLYFQKDNKIFKIESSGSFREVYASSSSFSDFHLIDNDIYLSVPGLGILKSSDATFYSPTGPNTKIQHFGIDENIIFAFPTFRDISGGVRQSSGAASSQIVEGIWQRLDFPEHAIASQSLGELQYIATRGDGLWLIENESLSKISLQGLPENASIRLLQKDNMGQIWVGIEDNLSRLLKIQADGSIENVAVQGLNFPQKIQVDPAGNLWILQSNNSGFTVLRVFNEDSGLNRVISTANNQGGLPNGVIQDIGLDRENRLWIGLSTGIVFIPNAPSVNNSSSINAIQPLFENAALLNGESITAIATAPDLSLWLGTATNGLWNFSDQGTVLLNHFTRQNSPIYSNEIVNLTFDDRSGELLIVLPEGGITYRTGTIGSFETLEPLKIYPNPVRPDFNGLLSIEGLSDFAEVKITNSSGRVVLSKQVRGGKLSWNLLDNSGNRPLSGVYLVYVRDEFGRERVAGKFVII